MRVPVGLTSLMDLELHSYAHVEVYSIFCIVTTVILLLMKVQTFQDYLYTFWVQLSLYDNKYSASFTWLDISSDL